MSIHAALTHRTSYRYDHPVTLGPQTIRLRPAPHARTPILAYSLTVSPKPHFLNWQQDPQGNFLARVVFPERVTHFHVTVDLIADMATINPFDFFLEPEAERWGFLYDPVLEQELAPYRRTEAAGPLLAELLRHVPTGDERTVDRLVAVNRMVMERVAYIVRMEAGVWSPEQTLAEARGSCRDSAWVLVQMLRHLGMAARFVSGYLIQLVADVKPIDGGAEGPSADFTDLHAWAEVYLPGAGWIGLDATSGLMTGEGHIPLAASPDPISAAPISGLVEPAETQFDVAMTVRRISETPRVTQPYTDAQWRAILDAGDHVDRMLDQGDVRLTMGGEPTFVSATDSEAAEWATDAMGPTKRRMAGTLLRRLVPLWAPGAVLTYGQGKQYPGEQLPRWALHAHWRADRDRVWRDPALLASDEDTGDATAEHAAAFARDLAGRLRVDPALVLPAFEDVQYYGWRERRLPVNVSPEDARLADSLERSRLARVFAHGPDVPVGSVLPLRCRTEGDERRWQAGRWHLRDERLFLIPGDSPLGLRLPLDSLPWLDPATVDPESAPDPFAPHKQFRSSSQFWADAQRGTTPDQSSRAQDRFDAEHDPDRVRTALAVEPRDGMLHVFLPPLYDAEDWLALIAAVEATAAAFGRKVFLEGYLPPDDDRILSFSVTPDPGVIEVNVHPAERWTDHVRRTEELYANARAVGLAAEKFLLDGRHVGTGGGNHVVMGAMQAADSPFLRRPDVLKSLLGFWHNHPSLSYLFSGLFIGPTSQHPRIDEARQDVLHELEIAFEQIAPHAPVPPWQTDRLLRNILADMTGNTHRTEFCIDKMYSPDGPGGRRGLVEFRAFEMPPHPWMSAAQMLLMRAAVAAFWRAPYDRRLIRWGTRLHDQFMLPACVERDFRDALEELAGLGAPIDPVWFAPHMAFRFPEIGEIAVNGMTVQLRHALEPWHVLGEEQTGSGTARYVDSSAERVQARVTGWVGERFTLACNGVAVPLHATERPGELIAGIRFKAWAPPSALHPGIGVQSPLVLEVFDAWTGRAMGGMAHHVSHPGGLSYDTFPVNAQEAEARRRSRFVPFAHTPGPMPAPRAPAGVEHPYTLDLRRNP